MFGKHLCLQCKNFLEEAPLMSDEFGKCKAFPSGIPYKVYAFMDNWNEPKNCNNGIGFEKAEDENISE